MMNKEQASAQKPEGKEGVWSIDAEASLQQVFEGPDTPPVLRRTLSGALVWQERNRRMVRRAVASPRIAPQWSAALVALGATVTLVGAEGSKEVPVETLLAGKPEGEITALHVRSRGIHWGEAHVSRAPADEPIVAAVAAVEMDNTVVRQARVAITGAGPLHLAKAASRLAGGPLTQDRIQAVAKAIEQEVTPEGDFRGSEEYRQAMSGVLARRALMQCMKEAGDND